MNIAVDIGNTRTKVSIHDGEREIWDAVYTKKPSEEVLARIRQFNPTTGIISSVAESGTLFKSNFPDIHWIDLHHQLKFPFHNKYNTPETLGLDRLALAAAGVYFYPKEHVLIIDAGTCVTYDFVNDQKEYMGGAISPGLAMRLKSMHQFTAKLPLVEVDGKVELIGQNTMQSLQSGALNGLAAEIDGMISRYQEQYKHLQMVLTGGDVKVLAPLIKNNIFARPKFLLEGLHVVAAYNTP